MGNGRRHIRAFVLQVEPPAGREADSLTGWIEHVDSGRTIRFAGAEDLLSFVRQMLTGTDDDSDA